MKIQWFLFVICGWMSIAMANEPVQLELEEEPVKADSNYATIYKMPVWVKQVKSVCPWQSKSDDLLQGHLRLIHGAPKEGDKLYIQWLKKLPNNIEEVLATREVEELINIPLRIQSFGEFLDSQSCQIIVQAKMLTSHERYRLEINISEPGQYRYVQVKELARGL